MAAATSVTVDTSTYVFCDPISTTIEIKGQSYSFLEGFKTLLDSSIRSLGPRMDGSHWNALKKLSNQVHQLDEKVFLAEDFLTDTFLFLQMLNDPSIAEQDKQSAIKVWFAPGCNIWEEKPCAKTALMALVICSSKGEQLLQATGQKLVANAVNGWLIANAEKTFKQPLSKGQIDYLINTICYQCGFIAVKPKSLPFTQRISQQKEVLLQCKAWASAWLQPYFVSHQLCRTASHSHATLPSGFLDLMCKPPEYDECSKLPTEVPLEKQFQAQQLYFIQSLFHKVTSDQPEVLINFPQMASEQKTSGTILKMMGSYVYESATEGIRTVKADDIVKADFSSDPHTSFILAAQIIDSAESLEELVKLFEHHPYLAKLPQPMTSALTQKICDRLCFLNKDRALKVLTPYMWQRDFSRLNSMDLATICDQLIQEHYFQVMTQAQSLGTFCHSACKCIFNVQCSQSIRQARLQSLNKQFSALYTKAERFQAQLLEITKTYAHSAALITHLHSKYKACLTEHVNALTHANELAEIVTTHVLSLMSTSQLQEACAQIVLARQKTLIGSGAIALQDMQPWQNWCKTPCMRASLQSNFSLVLEREVEHVRQLQQLQTVTHFAGMYCHLLSEEQYQNLTFKLCNKAQFLIEQGNLAASNGTDWLSNLTLDEVKLFHLELGEPELDKQRLLRSQTLSALAENDPSLNDVKTLNLMPDSFFEQCNNTIKANVLLKAVSESQLTLTKRLIAVNTNLDVQDKDKNNLLIIAAAKGSEDIVRHLLSLNHYSINVTNSQGQNALHKALFSQSAQVVTQILAVADATTLEQKSAAGFRPLHRAILVDNPECLHLLLKNKPNLEIQLVGKDDQERQGPMHLACRWKKPASLSVLIELHPELCTQKSSLGFTPLATAVRHGDVKGVTQLIQAKCDTATQTAKGENLIHLAARNTQCEAVFEIIWDLPELRAQRTQEINGLHVLEVAIQTHHHQAFDTCLNSGLFKLSQCKNGLNLIQYTAKHGDAHTMSEVIDVVCLGQSLNDNTKGTFEQKTALDLANNETRQVLVDKGAKTYRAIQDEIRRKREEEESHRRYVAGLESDNRRLSERVSQLRSELSDAESRISYAKFNMRMNGNWLGASMT
ncbi:ankyrin repeat domain-containing protein [Parashewanella tropica]|uniref:ankyrin repeat domain-containing protein n=1 Tax=Parashewanella tropica TaxID=2547970 RepID=UPI001059AA60|nr:ankyrin repeat domain-containing protein [Parashewanella tropica]